MLYGALVVTLRTSYGALLSFYYYYYSLPNGIKCKGTGKRMQSKSTATDKSPFIHSLSQNNATTVKWQYTKARSI